jgi:ParB family chromosome partitioning protein
MKPSAAPRIGLAPHDAKADEPPRARLGRGIAALLGDVDEDVVPANGGDQAAPRKVAIEFIRRNPHNPRTSFSEDELVELSSSIRERGIIQPLVVRAIPDLPDMFEIIAGERRWRAAQRAGLAEVPVVVIEADDKLALELAIVENVQRSDLNALDEAAGYDRLIGQHGYTQADLATTLGKSRSHVANTLRLLKLSSHVRGMIARSEISAGHGRALLSVEDPDRVADRIVEKGLTVRDVERLARGETLEPDAAPAPDAEPRRRKGRRAAASAEVEAFERDLADSLGLEIVIDHRDPAGEVRVRYRSMGELEALVRRLKG